MNPTHSTETKKPGGEVQGGAEWKSLGLADLADHIIVTHHTPLRRELPHLSERLAAAAGAGGERFFPLRQIRDRFDHIRSEVEGHMLMEEEVLFPLIRVLDYALTHEPCPTCDVSGYLGDVEHDHERFETALLEVRKLTHDYVAPPTAPAAVRELLSALQAMEADMRLHTQKEDVLIQRAKEAESRRRGGAGS